MNNCFFSPERTTLISSTHRIYATIEKMQMADGRFDSARVVEAARHLAKTSVLFDMRKLAQESGTVINAVLFGALAGSGVLPLSREACERAIAAPVAAPKRACADLPPATTSPPARGPCRQSPRRPGEPARWMK